MGDKKAFITRVLIDSLCFIAVIVPLVCIKFLVKPFQRGFFCNDTSIAYPYFPSTVPGVVVYVVGIGGTIIWVLLNEYLHYFATTTKAPGVKVKYVRVGGCNVNPYFTNVVYILEVFMFGYVMQQLAMNITKVTVGRLRPHFLTACKPKYELLNCSFVTANNVTIWNYVTIDDNIHCNAKGTYALTQMRLSFPSGHSAAASYCATYLMIYMYFRFTCTWSRLARPACQFACFVLALVTCLSRISDYKHHWSDVLGGVVLGAGVATLTAIVFTRRLHGLYDKYVSYPNSVPPLGLTSLTNTSSSSATSNERASVNYLQPLQPHRPTMALGRDAVLAPTISMEI